MKRTAIGHTRFVEATWAMMMGNEATPSRAVVSSMTRHPEDEKRIREMVDEHHAFTWRSLRRLGLPPDLADDAVQRVFLVAHERLADIREGCERAFLFNTALRVASSEKRAFARRREELRAEDEETIDAQPSVDEQLDRHRAREVLDELLEELDMDLRAVFVLFELEELSTAEVASTLEIPPGTASSRLRRARDEFQAATKRYHARARIGQGAVR